MNNPTVLTKEDIQLALPSRKGAVTDEAVEILNRALSEPEFQGESLLQSAVTYEAVMQRNKASITEYLNAIRFCAYLLTQDDNYTAAYTKTFIHRDFVKERMNLSTESTKYVELTSAASRYRRSKLVVDILTYSQVPLDLMFMGYRYKAVGVLANEMESAPYSRDRIAAAKELLAATKGADNVKVELDIGMSGEMKDSHNKMMEHLASVALNQQKMLELGYDVTDVQKLNMKIETTVHDYTDGEVL